MWLEFVIFYENIELFIELIKILFMFGLAELAIVGVMYLEDWRKIRKGRKMAKKIQLARVSWECPKCECRGGYSGDYPSLLVGLCVPTFEDPERAHCFGCGWVGDIDDATITAVEVPRNQV